MFNTWFITLLSVTPVPQAPVPYLSFLDLHSLPKQSLSLRKYFKCNYNSNWIQRAIIVGTLSFVHDDSYMSKVATKVYLAGFVLSYSCSEKQAIVTLTKCSDSTNNYCVNALEADVGLLVIKAESEWNFRYLDLVANCNTMSIVKHINLSSKPCPAKQGDTNSIVLTKEVIRGLPCKLEYKPVFGNLNDVLWWDHLMMVRPANQCTLQLTCQTTSHSCDC